ncbi:hypothetical protein ECOPH_gp39 [Escherichia phage vB_EcoM_ECO1230-10]|uniref:Uncharacterized protein n=1 Tax=Escherichia phage vB_EcoM_ECO1230-10 TaxID=669875 RepID=D5LH13_9CAUD|nr:hypothetical protein ECOPH_gp39 [Escherichia phage vB_EcoM_ECO1230-10]ADE87944.1 hypothetical protein [Escherichia phage vB_EcoM_ECO1230-10]
MFKRLLARLFGRKPKTVQNKVTITTSLRNHDDIVRALSSRPTGKATGHRHSSATISRRNDSSDPLNPLNPLSPNSQIYHSSGDSHHRSSGHDSGGYDGGSCDSSSSSSGGCD